MVTFCSGDALGIVGLGLVALVQDAPDSEVATRLWALASDGSPFESVTDELIGFGLANLPALIVAEIKSGSVRALVRGAMSLEIEQTNGAPDVAIDGEGFYTWNEYVSDDVVRVTMSLVGEGDTTSIYRTSQGLVPASRLVLTVDEFATEAGGRVNSAETGEGRDVNNASSVDVSIAPEARLEHDDEVEAAEPMNVGTEAAVSELLDAELESAAPDVTDFEDGSQLESNAASDSEREEGSEREQAADKEDGQQFEGQSENDAESDSIDPDAAGSDSERLDSSESARPVIELESPSSAPSVPTVGTGQSDSLTVRFDDELVQGIEGPVAASKSGVADPSNSPDISNAVDSVGSSYNADDRASTSGSNDPTEDLDHDDEVLTDDFGALFGETQFRPVASAGVLEDPAQEQDAFASGVQAPISSAQVPAATKLGSDSSAADSGSGDHDGMTITLAQLRASMGNASAPPPSGPPLSAPMPGPMVHAVTCASGHPNPPSAVTCRQCGLEIQNQAHVSVPRPSLGFLVFSSGERRELTRNLIIGRAPKLQGMVEGEMPELLTLPSPTKELSGTHLEVRIEGWQVLLVDRNSTNGTTVRLPNRDPQRLNPGESFPIVPGTWVDLAEEVQFTYEVTS